MLGDDHPSVGTTLTVRANVALAREEYAAAAADAAEAERILSPQFDASQWQMAMAMNAHGAALAGLGKFTEVRTTAA